MFIEKQRMDGSREKMDNGKTVGREIRIDQGQLHLLPGKFLPGLRQHNSLLIRVTEPGHQLPQNRLTPITGLDLLPQQDRQGIKGHQILVQLQDPQAMIPIRT